MAQAFRAQAFTVRSARSRQARAFATALSAALLSMGIVGSAKAADHILNNVSIDFGMVKIEIPRIEVRGTPLDVAGVTSLFDAKTSESAVTRFSRLNAASIIIPEFHLDVVLPGKKDRTTYSNTTASDIVAGKVGKMTTASTTSTSSDPTIGKIEQKLGQTTIEGMDLTLTAQFLTEAVKPGEKPEFKALYKNYEISDYAMKIGDIGTLKLASIKARDARVRQGETPLMALLPAMMELSKKQAETGGKPKDSKDMSKDEMKAIAGIFGLLENFEYGDMEAVGLTGTFRAPDGPLDLRMARMFFSDKPGQGEFRLEGFDLKGGPVKAALGTFSASGFSFASSLKVLTEAFTSGDLESTLAANPLKLIPKLGSIKMSGVMIEAPDPQTKDAVGKPEINKIGLRASEITVGAQKDGIPTAIKVTFDGLSMPISPREKRDGLKDIAALGYKAIDISMGVEGAWAEAKNQFNISNLSFSGVDMGSIGITGLLGNITKDVFSGDTALAQVALLGASAQKLDIKVLDKGLFAKVLERDAKAKKKTAEDLRKEFGMIAAVGLPAILGPSDGAKAIAAAVARFVAKPGTLTLSAAAKSPSGIGLADVIAISEPQAIFDKLDVKASAE
jgi:hypothetical protein